MDDFEQAVRVVFAQGPSIAPSVREQATGYCDAIKSRPDSWRFCWEQFLQKECLEVKFWCLQVVHQKIPTTPPAERQELRGKVLSWLRDVAPSKQEEVVVRNKLALVYVGLLKWDYLAGWSSGWRDLLSMLEKGPNLVDMFLRVLVTFDQEVVSDEVPRTAEDRQHSQLIKHAMREADVMHLAESWYMILGTFRQTAPQLVVDCLKAISIYIVWVEILTVANEKFLGAITGLIGEAGPPAMEACDCLAAVLAKKMPAGKKVQMLGQLQILRLLDGCMHRGSCDLQLLEKEATLFNAVGEVVLEAYQDLRVQNDAESAALAQAAWENLKRLMDFIFWFFSHQEYQIAGSVEPFLTAFFVKVKAFVVGGGDGEAGKIGSGSSEPGPCHVVGLDQMRPILTETLKLIIQRIAYPDWFQHNDPTYEDDDRHIAFLDFRRSLTKIYKRIFLVDEQLGFQFVQASVAQLTQSCASVRPMEAEAVLYLYKEAGEIVKDVGQHLQAMGPLGTCFVQLVDCEGLVRADHWAVQLGLIELYVRYGRIFALHKELFPRYGQRVVEAFVGSQGIRASEPCVVARSCFMFPRFLKLAKTQIVPFTEQIYNALKDLLVVQYIPSTLLPKSLDGSVAKVVVKGALKADDQAGLFEAVASLVAIMPPEQLRLALQMLLKGPADNLTEVLNAPPTRIAADILGFASWAARSIEAIATISKAFSVQNACASSDWEAILAVVARILERFVGQPTREMGLWRAALFLCRRMVEVLVDPFLIALETLLPLLYSIVDQADLTELTIFAHHIVCQYQRKTQPLLQKWLHVIFLRPYDVWKQMPEDSVQLKREKLELGCALLQLVKEAAQRCPGALLEPMLLQAQGQSQGGGASGHGQGLICFLLQGLADPQELRALFLAASAWSAMLEAATSEVATREAIVTALPLAQLQQRLLWCVARMDYGDAQAQKVLAEAAAILRSIAIAHRAAPQPLQQQAMEALQQALVGALPGLRSDLAPRRLCEGLSQDASIKDLRAALQQCAADWRRDCGG
mmetsp:Transcript_73561/g.157660  ORF Transcript_73561/g.157660 Transcript_73561/m.157660 type:complete len:1027 (-) Transcript_73561:37-3117(-)